MVIFSIIYKSLLFWKSSLKILVVETRLYFLPQYIFVQEN